MAEEETIFERVDRLLDRVMADYKKAQEPPPPPPQKPWTGPVRQDSSQPRQQANLATEEEAEGELSWDLINRLSGEQYDARRSEIQRWIASRAQSGRGGWR